MPEFVTSPAMLVLVGVLSYLLGSVPFGLVMARLFGLGDIRKIGSGNIGATNVLRTGNRLAAFLTLVLDAGKGAISVLLARSLVAEDAAILAGLAAFVGHIYPIWLRFRGGKGVATFIGTVLALSPGLGAAAAATWLFVAALSRRSSLAALMAAATFPIWSILGGRPDLVLVGTIFAALIFWRHRENIRRLRDGSEPRIGRR
ncbi:MAG: glycerol-3-phosphate 1-O-acyltransferase [Alphaproteobacteria bacterium]|nr:MAG: glycerol-3-phosphate 1-O-acyltransferase [Alphaproteobacteria bacterium]